MPLALEIVVSVIYYVKNEHKILAVKHPEGTHRPAGHQRVIDMI